MCCPMTQRSMATRLELMPGGRSCPKRHGFACPIPVSVKTKWVECEESRHRELFRTSVQYNALAHCLPDVITIRNLKGEVCIFEPSAAWEESCNCNETTGITLTFINWNNIQLSCELPDHSSFGASLWARKMLTEAWNEETIHNHCMSISWITVWLRCLSN